MQLKHIFVLKDYDFNLTRLNMKQLTVNNVLLNHKLKQFNRSRNLSNYTLIINSTDYQNWNTRNLKKNESEYLAIIKLIYLF